MPPWLYALLCLTLPALWGIAAHALFSVVERRRRQPPGADELPPVDYSI